MEYADVRDQVVADDEGKWDLTLPRSAVGMAGGSLTIPQEHANGNPSALTPTPWALTQMCQRLGIPTAYFKRCPTDLQDSQFNYWTQHATNGSAENGSSPNAHERKRSAQPEQWMLRARNDSLRGVLSDRDSRLDNAPLLQHMEPVLKAPFQIGDFALTDESLHLRIIDPHYTREILPNDSVTVGVHIANSEVGRRAVTIDALVYRLVCSNGLIRLVKGKSLLYQRHVFVTVESLKATVHQVLGEALTEAATLVEHLRRATQRHLPDVDGTLKQLGERWNLSDNFQEQVRTALTTEPAGQQETVYGLVNAFTNAAQHLSPDDRYDIEVMAGTLLDGMHDTDLRTATTNGNGHRPTMSPTHMALPTASLN